MLNHWIRFSLRYRPLVLVIGLALMVYGGIQLRWMPVDVFPDLNRPTVTIMTEAAGLATEEVESLVTRPIELVLNGATNVHRLRSTSSVGLSVIWVEFEWGTDIFRDRQIVEEKLQLARTRLPEGMRPTLAPISSIMGEIMLIGVRSQSAQGASKLSDVAAMEIRTWSEFTLRNRLLGIEGVSQVSVMGGMLKQYQILTSPERLAMQNISLTQLEEAAKNAHVLAGGGILQRSPKESVVRIQGQSLSLEDIEETLVEDRDPFPLKIRDVADVRFGSGIRRGDGGSWIKTNGIPVGGDAVILAIQKQPKVNTIELDARIHDLLDELEREMPTDFVLDRNLFRQASFIRRAIDNVQEAVRDGAIGVVVILFLVIGNLRTSVSSLTSMPLSILLTVLVFHWTGISINTMTLGGIAVAIGDLVDDSIVDIENIYRRLRENHRLPADLQRSILDVVYKASSEVRSSIVYATAIVILVTCPLFAMHGLEGRIFAPLALAYVISLLCSLVVSLTWTPVIGSYLLANRPNESQGRDSWILRKLKDWDAVLLRRTLKYPLGILGGVLFLSFVSILGILAMGSAFLPDLNEGVLTINLRLEPGTDLEESTRLGKIVETVLLEVEEVQSVSRRTGRAEMDEHAEGVNSSELDVRLREEWEEKTGWWFAIVRRIPMLSQWGYRCTSRPRPDVLSDVRERVSSIPGVAVNLGQPISHRLDHVMSGVRAQIAVKVFGDDLREIQSFAFEAEEAMKKIRGVVDLQIEPQVEVSQIRLEIDRRRATQFGLTPGDIGRYLETAGRGKVVAQLVDRDRFFDLVVWFDRESRERFETLENLMLETPSGRRISLDQVVRVNDTVGPSMLSRENGERRIVISCNVDQRDAGSVLNDIQMEMKRLQEVNKSSQSALRIVYGGQLEAQQGANRMMVIFGTLSVIGILVLLTHCLRSWRAALQVMINVPLAAFGSVVTLWMANPPEWAQLSAASWWEWPRLWAEATTLTVAHWVGFLTLIGVVSRNGILMISHYIYLIEEEGEPFDEETIIRGSQERIAPVLMTALTSMVGLLPLLVGEGETGKEILHPLALVVFGGMVVSTLLDQLVTPALFYRFGYRPSMTQDR